MTTKDITALAQTNRCLTILRIIFNNPKKSIQDICAEEDMPYETFHYWISRSPELIPELRVLITEGQRDLLTEISRVRVTALKKVMDAATNDLTDLPDRIKALEYLDKEFNTLQNVYHAAPGIEEEANNFLKKGVVLQKQTSRFSSIEAERSTDGLTINLTVQQSPILDLQALDVNPDEEEPQDNTESLPDQIQ